MRHAALIVLLSAAVTPAFAGQLGPDKTNPVYLQDRGTGIPTSMFGTYIRKNELIVYPFFEYYRDSDFEYKPEELGAPGDVDYRGRYHASEGLFFVGYGVSENIAVEFEAAVISASFHKSPAERSSSHCCETSRSRAFRVSVGGTSHVLCSQASAKPSTRSSHVGT
jgi:hypothetical protein